MHHDESVVFQIHIPDIARLSSGVKPRLDPIIPHCHFRDEFLLGVFAEVWPDGRCLEGLANVLRKVHGVCGVGVGGAWPEGACGIYRQVTRTWSL